MHRIVSVIISVILFSLSCSGFKEVPQDKGVRDSQTGRDSKVAVCPTALVAPTISEFVTSKNNGRLLLNEAMTLTVTASGSGDVPLRYEFEIKPALPDSIGSPLINNHNGTATWKLTKVPATFVTTTFSVVTTVSYQCESSLSGESSLSASKTLTVPVQGNILVVNAKPSGPEITALGSDGSYVGPFHKGSPLQDPTDIAIYADKALVVGDIAGIGNLYHFNLDKSQYLGQFDRAEIAGEPFIPEVFATAPQWPLIVLRGKFNWAIWFSVQRTYAAHTPGLTDEGVAGSMAALTDGTVMVGARDTGDIGLITPGSGTAKIFTAATTNVIDRVTSLVATGSESVLVGAAKDGAAVLGAIDKSGTITTPFKKVSDNISAIHYMRRIGEKYLFVDLGEPTAKKCSSVIYALDTELNLAAKPFSQIPNACFRGMLGL